MISYSSFILQKYTPNSIETFEWELIKLKNDLHLWAGKELYSIVQMGSRAKNTAISGSSDIDLLVSLYGTNSSLSEIHDDLYQFLRKKKYNCIKQNVSIGIILGNNLLNLLEVDVTPARLNPNKTDYHSIYVRKFNSWMQTNVVLHNRKVKYSGRIDEIKLVKIWRDINKLDFPSIYLELLIIEMSLRHENSLFDLLHGLDDSFMHIVKSLSNPVSSLNPLFMRIVDPANSNNIISDLLNSSEKQKIITAATKSMRSGEITKILK